MKLSYYSKTGVNRVINTLSIDLGVRTYPVHIGKELLTRVDVLRDCVGDHRVCVVTDEMVAPLYLERVCDTLGQKDPVRIVLPAGERHKTLATFEDVCSRLLQARVGRDTTLVALGGGVIGDITGFVAACYQRGVDFIQVPTTLLAQVDSSVGGKTGVNHALGKNMIGAFYQPRAVVIDLGTLSTLPPRHFSAGLAEIIKYGMILDADFFGWLEANVDRLMARDVDALTHAIFRSCQIKAQVVARDERESTGYRMLLNLGHTFGHAIESVMGYGEWLHGEAVACGLLLAATLSRARGHLDDGDVSRVATLLDRARLPRKLPADARVDGLLAGMARDKKHTQGKYRLVLLEKIGKAFIDDSVTESGIADFLMAQRSQA